MKSFDQKLKDGEIMTVETVAALVGYSPQHLRRLCQKKKIAHHRRNDVNFFFTREDYEALFAAVGPANSSPRHSSPRHPRPRR